MAHRLNNFNTLSNGLLRCQGNGAAGVVGYFGMFRMIILAVEFGQLRLQLTLLDESFARQPEQY
jgi:hypothetical protein